DRVGQARPRRGGVHGDPQPQLPTAVGPAVADRQVRRESEVVTELRAAAVVEEDPDGRHGVPLGERSGQSAVAQHTLLLGMNTPEQYPTFCYRTVKSG